MLKNYSLFLLGACFLFVPFISFAQEEVDEAVYQEALRNELLLIQSETQAEPTFNQEGEKPGLLSRISNFARNLVPGDKGEDVAWLQKFLTATGDYKFGEATGNYLDYTVAAVQSWQARLGIVNGGTPETTGFGVVGPKTRSFLDMLIIDSNSHVGSVGSAATPAVIAGCQAEISEDRISLGDSIELIYAGTDTNRVIIEAINRSERRRVLETTDPGSFNGTITDTPNHVGLYRYKVSVRSTTGLTTTCEDRFHVLDVAPIAGGEEETENNPEVTEPTTERIPLEETKTTALPANTLSLADLTPIVKAGDFDATVTLVAEEAGIAQYDVWFGKFKIGKFLLQLDRDSIRAELLSEHTLRYQFGVRIKGNTVFALDFPETSVRGGESYYYPYNWTQKHEQIAQTELVMPGMKINDLVIARDATELFRIRTQKCARQLCVDFYQQREAANNGGDGSSQYIVIEGGQTNELKLLIADSVKELQAERFGRVREMNGIMTQAAFRGWGSTEEGYYLPDEDFEEIASGLKAAGLNHVALRLNEPKAEYATFFTDEGITPHYYLFLGVARSRRMDDGAVCYSLAFKDTGINCVDDWLIREANGDIYHPSNDAWALVDVRNPEYRAAMVEQARDAIENGYGGVFFDGPQLWAGQMGVVGGANNGQNTSWYHARATLLAEVRAAVRGVNPNAYVGILGNEYVDFQAEADYVMKELVRWETYADDPRDRTVVYNKRYLGNLIDLYKYYYPQFMLGVKGNDPAKVKEMQDGAKSQGTPADLVYVGIGDFRAEYVDEWLEVITDVAKKF